MILSLTALLLLKDRTPIQVPTSFGHLFHNEIPPFRLLSMESHNNFCTL
jgi:hypothetical protein